MRQIKYEGGPVLVDRSGEYCNFYEDMEAFLADDGSADEVVYVAHEVGARFDLDEFIEGRDPPDGLGEVLCSYEERTAFEKTVNDWLKTNVSTWYEAGARIDVVEYVARKAAPGTPS